MSLFYLLFIAAVLFSGAPLQDRVVKDCGTGLHSLPTPADECFVSNLATCTPTRMTVESGDDIYRLTTMKTADGCTVNLSIVQARSEELLGLEEKNVTCTQTNMQEFVDASQRKGQDALDFINSLRLGIAASAIGGINACEGSLKDYFDTL